MAEGLRQHNNWLHILGLEISTTLDTGSNRVHSSSSSSSLSLSLSLFYLRILLLFFFSSSFLYFFIILFFTFRFGFHKVASGDLSNEREIRKMKEVISIGCYYICYQDPDYLSDYASC